MPATPQISPSEALDFRLTSENHCSVLFPDGITFWSVSNGGFTVAAMAKAVQLSVAQHPKASRQTHPRTTMATFLRPIYPNKGPVDIYVQKASVGKTFSNFRVELFQGNRKRLCATADVLMTDFSLPGPSLSTHWALSPPAARPVSLQKMETGEDPNWTCWHATYNTETIPCCSYIKYFIPVDHPWPSTFIEHWISPGWDHTPAGSRDPSLPEARFTTEMINFIADMAMPMSQHVLGSDPGQKPRPGSIPNAIAVGALQHKALVEGKGNWRESAYDGSKGFSTPLVATTLSMWTEIKRSLPAEGTRWLYVRCESKSIHNGRMDMQVLIFTERMELVATSYQAVHLVQTDDKIAREASL